MSTNIITPQNAKGIVKEGRAGPGRPPGSVNKVPAQIKDMIATALSEEGGVKYFQKIAQEQPVAFCGLIGKIIPLQVEGNPDNPLILTVTVGSGSSNET